ncbi:uncharacterized protein LOC122510128 [Leptopilina heterotoma]|uniref:uncharacterized protein LOC122510128 n=1 Tax=Leptopilina heterotoma TaxID=63436 RepID=UPI001CA92EA0|nr:uncharacterized protein LOC122510128 [Leptopilina heterotoma]XP_043480497.1 uncharacterized protein LOC122510128 [Leptopilina heterotoma]
MDRPLRCDQGKMETNPSGETELSEMKIVTSSIGVTATNQNHSEDHQCRNGTCKISRIRNNQQPENPWHYLKTIFLISVIIALIIWIIVYTLLVQYKVL